MRPEPVGSGKLDLFGLRPGTYTGFNEAGARGLRKTGAPSRVISPAQRFNEAGARGLRKTRF